MPTSAALTLDGLKTILRGFSPQGEELERQVAMARNPLYWFDLNPSHNTDGRTEVSIWDAHIAEDEFQYDRALKNYRTFVWLALDAVLYAEQLARMRRCVESVRRAGWPVVFSFVYDDFWLVGRQGRLRRLIADTLGPEFVLLPRVWTHYVYPAHGNAGWKPHIDDKGATKNLSVWIPISNATLTNGCMYIIQRDEATREMSQNFTQLDNFTRRDVVALLRNARALPASPGQVLCWDEHVIHWGGLAEPPTDGIGEPRISIALEFSTPNFPITKEVPFVIRPDEPLPSFETRLASIALAILSYRRFELLAERFAPLAEKLSAELGMHR
jgi:hypothetical protein